MTWIDLAQTVGAVATTAGVLIALYVALDGGHRQRRADHRDQASRVSVHTERRESPAGYLLSYPAAVIINASLSPIYDVVVGGGVWGARNTEEFKSGSQHNHLVAVVPPGSFAVANPRGLTTGQSTTDTHGNEVEVKDGLRRGPTVTFRDANSVIWQRNANGTLSEVKGPTTPISRRGLTDPLPWAEIRSV